MYYKKISTSIASALLVTGAFAQGISFEKNNTSLQTLINKAKTENKLLFIDAMADWCGPCKLMSKNVFTQKPVADFYNANFINAKLDMQKDAVGREVAQMFGVQSFPTFLFLNGDGQLVIEAKGYMDQNTFIQLGQEAANAPKTLAQVKQKFLNGDHSPEVLTTIVKTYRNTEPQLAKKASEIYFQNKKDTQLSQEEIGMILMFVTSTEDTHYQYLTKYKKEIEKYIDPAKIKNFDNQLQIQKIWRENSNIHTKTINDAQFLAQATNIVGNDAAQKILNIYKLNFYEETEQLTEYEKIAKEMFQNNAYTNNSDVLKAAWNIAEKSNDKKIIKEATVWVERQIMNHETPHNAFILSKLYHKMGKKNEAIMFAESAIRLAEQNKQDTEPLKKYLKTIQ